MNTLGPSGTTAIGLGLQRGVESLLNQDTARPYAQKTVVIMTDGCHNTGATPETVATTVMAQYNPLIQTVTFGGGADQTRMQEVATIGSGRHWHADTAGQLDDAYVQIAEDIPTVLTQ